MHTAAGWQAKRSHDIAGNYNATWRWGTCGSRRFSAHNKQPTGCRCVSLAATQVITREVDGVKCEPYEEAVVEVPETYVGSVVELFAQRKGEMMDMQPSIEVSVRL